MTSRQHTVFALILVLSGLYLMRLSWSEIQPWDEGLYAVRAQSIIEFNAWWDQTPHALGGLYSSTAPPFVSWLIAVFMTVFGPTVLAVRIPIVFCSAVSLWMVYLIARRMVTYEHSLLAVCVMAGTMHWTLFARQGMTEVPLMMWCLIALWSTLVWKESERELWWPPVVFGLALGFACLTKMLISFTPMLFLVPLAIQRHRSRRFVFSSIVALLLAVVVSAPWYITMVNNYGMSFLSGVPLMHVLSAVEGNSQSLGPIFYLNQLIIGNALFAVLLVYLATSIFKRKLLPQLSQNAAVSVLAWFVSTLVIFSLAATRHVHYTVMIVPAAVLGSIYAVEQLLLFASRRLVAFTYGLVSAIVIWAMLPMSHRQLFRTSPFDTVVLIEAAAIGFVLLTGLLVPRRHLQVFALRLFKPVIYGAVAAFLIQSTVIIFSENTPKLRGGWSVATALKESTSTSFIYLYHKHNDGDALNPQLAWYLDGWMAGWTLGRSYNAVGLPEDGVSDSLNVLGITATSRLIVYLHGKQSLSQTLERKVDLALAPSYSSKTFQDYTLYTRRR